MNCIYVLYCPISNNPIYVGKSMSGLERPFQHIKEKSHSEKVNTWIRYLKDGNREPILTIVESFVQDDLLVAKELFWINYFLSKGYFLLNQKGIEPAFLEAKIIENSVGDDYLTDIRNYVKVRRKLFKLTQQELAMKSGVGIRFIRDLEQGSKTNFNTDSINKVLHLLGNSKLSVVLI